MFTDNSFEVLSQFEIHPKATDFEDQLRRRSARVPRLTASSTRRYSLARLAHQFRALRLTMLCELCSSIDLDQVTVKPFFQHQVSCVELVKSAERGCELCSRIWDERVELKHDRLNRTPQEYDKYQNTQLRLIGSGYEYEAYGISRLSISSESGAFRCFLDIYAGDSKFM